MKKHIFIPLSIITLFLTLRCSSSDDSQGNTIPPAKATLVFPDNNRECTEGSNFTATESDIRFRWNAADNAEDYQLVLTNLNTQITENYDTTMPELNVRVLRATPYAWYVTAKNATSFTTQSDTWQFYNAGEATSTYAPFPAELLAPAMGSTIPPAAATVLLEWQSNDVDNDVSHHEIRFDTANPPVAVLESNNLEQSITANISSGHVYYWQVITTDNAGHTSKSAVFQFRAD